MEVRLRSFAPATAAFVHPALQWIAWTFTIQMIFLGFMDSLARRNYSAYFFINHAIKRNLVAFSQTVFP